MDHAELDTGFIAGGACRLFHPFPSPILGIDPLANVTMTRHHSRSQALVPIANQ
jgi:hypothetical protein